MDSALPIDVNYKQLVSWLTGRQKLAPDWNLRLVALQAKATQCFKDLPSDVVMQLKGSADTPVDYARAVEIRHLLASTSDRSLFGGLTGSAAAWDKLVKVYEKGGVFLGEAALALVQNAEYELPYLRKQAAKARQVVEDAERRNAEYTRSAAAAATVFAAECASLGVSPDVRTVARELQGLTAQLPSNFAGVLSALGDSTIGDAIKYYHAFTAYAHVPAAADLPAGLLPTLLEVREGRTAAPPEQPSSAAGGDAASAAPQPVAAMPSPGAGAVEASAGPSTAVRWDDGTSAGAVAGAGIAWDVGGAAEEAVEPAVLDIAWDVGLADGGDEARDGGDGATTGAGVEAGGSGVDWGIDMAGQGCEGSSSGGAQGPVPAAIDWAITVDEADGGQGSAEAALGPAAVAAAAGLQPPAVGGDAVTRRLVADPGYRAQLIDDLLELRAFLGQRRADLGAAGAGLLAGALPEALQAVDAATVSTLLGAVDAALAQLQAPRLAQLLLLAGSPRYLERLVGALQRKAGQEAKMVAAAREASARGNEARLQLAEASRKVAALVERTRAIKAATEAALSKAFGGRRFNIMGDINMALASTLA